MKSEYEIWREELSREKLTLAERIRRLGEYSKSPTSEPDMFVWHDVADLIPVTVARERSGSNVARRAA